MALGHRPGMLEAVSRAQIPVADALAVIDAFAELVADKVVERSSTGPATSVERAGFSTRDAAAGLGCSERHERTLVDDGVTSSVRLGNRGGVLPGGFR